MDTAISQHLSRISKTLLAAIGVAFAWVLLSFALGLSAAHAHADDDGLLGGLTSTVDDTTTAVTGVVEDTAAAVVAPVATVVETVVEPAVEPVAPVVQQITAPAPVAPVVDAVEAALTPVANSLADATESGVVAPVVDSTLSVVDAVPVVGEVVSGLGVDTAASSVGSSVDGVLGGTTGAVIDTVGTVTAPVTAVIDTATGGVTAPVLPAIPPLTAPDGVLVSTVATTPSDAAPGALETLARAAYLTGASAWLALIEMPTALLFGDGAGVSSGGAGILPALLRSVLQADSVFIGPGGAGPGAWVLVALGFVVAYRAWVRRTGLENDVAPPAPTLSTDVSPD